MGDATTFPIWFPFFFVGLWLFVGAILSELARWPELAFRFPGGDEPPGRTLHGQVVSIGIVGENNVTVITLSERGLYLRAIILFRFRRPPPKHDLSREVDAVEQGDEADEVFGGMVASMDMPPHARAVNGMDAGTASQLIPGVRPTRRSERLEAA